MTQEPSTAGILAKPLGPGAFRVCMDCRAWFALVRITKRDDEQQRANSTYRCKKCNSTFDFADHHPPDVI